MSNEPIKVPPLNEEHAEAVQAATNDKRKECVAKFSPEEQERMAMIERMSQELTAAKIPFVLFASPIQDDNLKKDAQFWQFHKLDYQEDFTTTTHFFHMRGLKFLVPALNDFISFFLHPSFIGAFDKKGGLIYGHYTDGKVVHCPPLQEEHTKIRKKYGLL